MKQESEQRALADRLVNYSDAIVALAFLVASGLGLAAADPDTRASFVDVTSAIITGNIIMGVLFSGLLLLLRYWEVDLRDSDTLAPNVRRYSLYIYIARHAVIWLTVLQTAGIMLLIS